MMILALFATMAVFLSGCTLAREEIEPEDPHRLVGLNVYVDPGDASTDRNEPHELDGQYLYVNFRYDEEGACIVGVESTNDFGASQFAVHEKDDDSEYSLTAELYVCPEQLPKGVILRFEPIYQRPDGSIYAINTGSNFSGHLAGMAHDLSAFRTITSPDGTTNTETVSIHIKVVGVSPCVSAKLMEMDENNTELHRLMLGEENEIAVSPDAAWVLLEEQLLDGTTRRTAYNTPFDQAEILLFREGEMGLCQPTTYSLNAAE